MTRLALVNAIYFKGNWMNRFDASNTKEMPFKVDLVNTISDYVETSPDIGLRFLQKPILYKKQITRVFVVSCVAE